MAVISRHSEKTTSGLLVGRAQDDVSSKAPAPNTVSSFPGARSVPGALHLPVWTGSVEGAPDAFAAASRPPSRLRRNCVPRGAGAPGSAHPFPPSAAHSAPPPGDAPASLGLPVPSPSWWSEGMRRRAPVRPRALWRAPGCPQHEAVTGEACSRPRPSAGRRSGASLLPDPPSSSPPPPGH